MKYDWRKEYKIDGNDNYFSFEKKNVGNEV